MEFKGEILLVVANTMIEDVVEDMEAVMEGAEVEGMEGTVAEDMEETMGEGVEEVVVEVEVEVVVEAVEGVEESIYNLRACLVQPRRR
jgi:hypothetical protein